jgi:hypothetical protein
MGYIPRDSGIRIPSAAIAPKFSHIAAASGAGANWEFDPQAATTSGASGNFVVNVGVPASGTTEAGIVFQRNLTSLAYLGAPNGLGTSFQLSMGYGSGANTGAYIQLNAGSMFINAAGGTVRLESSNTAILDLTTSNILCNAPIQGFTTGTPFKLGQSQVTTTANGTTTLTSTNQQTPLLIMSNGAGAGVTLTGNSTIDFGGVIGNWWVDFTLITPGANTITLKNGAGTFAITALITATKQLVMVSARTAALITAG